MKQINQYNQIEKKKNLTSLPEGWDLISNQTLANAGVPVTHRCSARGWECKDEEHPGPDVEELRSLLSPGKHRYINVAQHDMEFERCI